MVAAQAKTVQTPEEQHLEFLLQREKALLADDNPTADTLREIDTIQRVIPTAQDAIRTAKLRSAKSGENVSRYRGLSSPLGSYGFGSQPVQASSPLPESKRMARLFRDDSPSNFGYESAHDFFQAVILNDSHRLMLGQNTISDPAGGWAVPPAYSFGVQDMAAETEVVFPRANVVPMGSNEHNFTDFDDSDHSSGELDGGLTGSWVVETGDLSYKAAELKRETLTANKLAFLVSISNEMLTDAATFESRFTMRMSRALAWNRDRTCLITGTGVGQPEAVLNSPSLITVAKETGQAADTILYANLVKMFARMHPMSLPKSTWVVNQTALPQLLQLSIPVGTGGAHVPVLNESNGTYKILGRPVVFSEKMNPVGDLGDIMLADFSQYVVGVVKNGLRIDSSAHIKFETDQTVFRTVWRGTGKTLWRNAFTPANGDTLSWAVTLAARA